ncbi:MAG TPA: SDR family oxidoreductase [Ferrovibrio sp.]|jgi:3-oxoacyl-[acyl-carrier protein] reductase|uniref:SDR family NAD(P)-dependent oxidoreductase n=1 Tax=Ferrovibrio sp. TaxID=1917215 RepID=UPI002ED1A146
MPSRSFAYQPAVVVTGGSSGIGAAFCRLAAQEGWHVWIGYGKGAGRAELLAEELNRAGNSAMAIRLPLDDADSLRQSIAAIASHQPIAEALVLCAAPPPTVAPFLKQMPDDFRRQFESTVVGTHLLLADFWRGCLRRRGGGHVLAVLSAALGPPAAPHMASYICAKSGLAALLQSAAAEFGRAGLRISMVNPGYVETPMLQAFQPLLLERARAAAPGRRFLHAEEVARTLLHGLQNPPPPGAIDELPLPTAMGPGSGRASAL